MDEIKKVEFSVSRFLEVGDKMTNKVYDSFDAMRSDVNKIVNSTRNDWLVSCLMKHGVIVNLKTLSNRDKMVELFDLHGINLSRVEKKNIDYDVILKKGELIGVWNNNRQMKFGHISRKLYLKIEYYIK